MKNQRLKFGLVAVLLFFAFQDKLEAQELVIPIDSLKNYDFVSIERPPSYPGGLQKFYEYLGRNIRYPKQARKDNVGGPVLLSFVVEKTGKLTDVTIQKGVRKDLDDEALRVVENSPKWNPGVQDGKPVRVKYNVNINFNLN